MHVKRLLLLLTGLFALQILSAQDVHFTQYYLSPQTLNPAMTGNFQGTVRVGGIYREQWRSVISKWRFTTPSVYIDAPIMRGLRRKDWIAVGGMLLSDKAGETKFQQDAFKICAAYHLALDKKATTILTLGAHYGSETAKLNKEGDAYRFEDELLGAARSSDRTALDVLIGQDNERPKTSANVIDAGLMLTGKLNKTMGYTVGFAMFRIRKPDFTLLTSKVDTTGGGPPNPGTGSSNYKRPRRNVLHGQLNVELNKQWSFNPTFLFQTMSGADEIILQALTGYKIDPKKDITLNMGIGYRMRDAASLIVGMKKKELTVGFAYDINTSGLTQASSNRGGWELAANYIFRIYKPAVVKPKVFCPRF